MKFPIVALFFLPLAAVIELFSRLRGHRGAAAVLAAAAAVVLLFLAAKCFL